VQIILISGRSANHAGQSLDPRDRFIQKPFTRGHLLGAIEQAANKPPPGKDGMVRFCAMPSALLALI
jgi:hypothetical protein